MRAIRRHWIALIILCLFVGLGVLYSVATPIFEASDDGGEHGPRIGGLKWVEPE